MAPSIQARNPLRSYQFRVGIITSGDASTLTYVAGVKSVSGLRVSVSAWETWEGGNNRHRYANPNKVMWEPVTLEAGLALDDTFERWTAAVVAYSTDGTITKTEPVKRQVVIDLWDENMYPGGPPALAGPLTAAKGGQLPVPSPRSTSDVQLQFGVRCRRYHLKNAWISKYAPLPKLDAMTSEVALLSVELVHEGWVKENIPSP